VVSSLTFREVRDVADRTASVAEALRVLEPGGRFAFVDLFDDEKVYSGRDRVLCVIASAGGAVESDVSDLDYSEQPPPWSRLTLRRALLCDARGNRHAESPPESATPHGSCW
jgi:hypothetical protein